MFVTELEPSPPAVIPRQGSLDAAIHTEGPFLGFAALAYAIVPRASAAIAYGLVTVAFLWDLVGSLLSVPRWLVKLTPFTHIGLVPAQPFRIGDAAIMLAIAAACALAAAWVFARRDLTGA